MTETRLQELRRRWHQAKTIPEDKREHLIMCEEDVDFLLLTISTLEYRNLELSKVALEALQDAKHYHEAILVFLGAIRKQKAPAIPAV